MKLKNLIAQLEQIAVEHGDIDVACTENSGGEAKDVALSPVHLVLSSHLRHPPTHIRHPFLLIGGTSG